MGFFLFLFFVLFLFVFCFLVWFFFSFFFVWGGGAKLLSDYLHPSNLWLMHTLGSKASNVECWCFSCCFLLLNQQSNCSDSRGHDICACDINVIFWRRYCSVTYRWLWWWQEVLPCKVRVMDVLFDGHVEGHGIAVDLTISDVIQLGLDTWNKTE